ncbi:MAG TPA: hypothetical protein VKH43_11740, partial [Thermoanaerobaculia bacterium]|nr:hypothetical protein [Thermoanaerobaculia bacterium]
NRASDGYGFQGWTGATNAQHVVIARGLIYAIGDTDPGRLYEIEPANPPGSVTTVASNLGSFPFGGAFDGERLWAACNGAVCIATPQDPPPFSVMTATTGFSRPFGMLYDGANIWVTDRSAGSLLKLDGNGAILQTVTVGSQPGEPAFDGTNLWVPVGADSAVAVVRASTGVLLRTLTGNGLNDPFAAAFDGQRVLVTNIVNPSVSLWEAAGLSVLGNVSLGNLSSPRGACSDGTRFWIALIGSNQLGMF